MFTHMPMSTRRSRYKFFEKYFRLQNISKNIYHVSIRSRDSMRVRRDGWRRDGGRFMRSRVVVVVGVVLLEPSLFVDFAWLGFR
jgi:hypothetical protein